MIFLTCLGGGNVDSVINDLNTFSGDALSGLMDNIFRVADVRGITALSMTTTDLCAWIREIIKINNLRAIVFIWDEFTEYFYNNSRNLTGFQELCEISETDPFYFILVTHVTQGLFHERDKDFAKLNDRFVQPHSLISLPENIAFQLMGAALEKNEDLAILGEWEDVVLGDLKERTKESRKLVMNVAHITDTEMVNILPIHPYAALLLKHISSAFDSNQRSMFDFIKNDRGDDIKGFQWFIDNYGPYDENPLLTVDMLWDFFYEKGKEYLSHDIRSVLDYFGRVTNSNIDADQKRALKAILLLSAISQYAGDSVELFIPNDKNLENAFEGSDIESSVTTLVKRLLGNKIIFQKSLGGGKFQYAPYSNEAEIDVRPFEKEVDQRSTSAFINDELSDGSRIVDAISLDAALRLRYALNFVSVSDFDSKIRQLRNNEESFGNKIVAVVSFAKDDTESAAIGKLIHKALEDGSYKMIFIDASRNPFGVDGYEQYRHEMALSMSQNGKDNALAEQYEANAKDELKKWKNRIINGEFVVYSAEKPEGERATSMDMLGVLLKDINRKKYPDSLEGNYNVIANMYTATNLKLGVECACKEKTSGTYNSGNVVTKLEKALEGAWQVDKYWDKNPNLLISRIKMCVDEKINEKFKAGENRVSISDIYEVLKAAPYGFMPCNFSAFILGFVLKEYTNGTYSWSDGLTSEELTLNKLKEMIDEVIHLDITPNFRYKDKYIGEVTQ